MVPTALAQASGEAQRLYREGQQSYDDGNYATAIESWTRSYELSREPGLLFNLGQAYRLAGRCADALGAYRKFVELDLKSTKRELAQGFIAELTPKCGNKPKTKPKVEVKPVAPVVISTTKSRGRTKRIAGISIAGGGVLLIGLGAYYGHRADVLGDEVSRECQDGCVWATVSSRDAEGKRDEKMQWTFVGLGSAAVVTGAVLYYLGWKADGEHVAVQPVAGGRGIALTWSRSW
jgi:tetratricopeptide (TPR) repeat protein